MISLGGASGFLAQLKPGDLVVHLKYGIGRYLGLQQLAVAGTDGEYLLIEYADGDRLYLPVMDFDLVTVYCGAAAQYPLDRLGNNNGWTKRKRKLRQQLEDTAAKLLTVYARRQVALTKPWRFPDTEYQEFAERFAYPLTIDQQRAVDDVIHDLCSGHLMDRLICGDVGFGKTEVALRAIFIAFVNGFQTAVLVPTTILGQQHFDHFRHRLSYRGAQVAFLHAGQDRGTQNTIKQQLVDGKIDILIATHRLLQSDIRFARLKLLVVDEEHRFGVQQKELVTRLSEQVSVLSLSATPIPRTMQLALTNLRAMSVISTPPARRFSIRTIVKPYDVNLVREAIKRELSRHGRVFYLHNRVHTLEYTVKRLSKLLPNTRITAVHGQMNDEVVRQIMEDFRVGKIDILVCTTVIESGLDVPDANTIIIERADLLGLAQLHQLRGRVGRAGIQGYAYLLLPAGAGDGDGDSCITEMAERRLQAIMAMQDLGSGFNLAMQDLEIRGVGEFLGKKQSGLLNGVGFALYQSLMTRAMELVQRGQAVTLEDLEVRNNVIDITLPAFIPEKYLDDAGMRLMLYKQISDCGELASLQALQSELQNKLGDFPPALNNLFKLKMLSLRAIALRIQRIVFDRHGLNVELATTTQWDWRVLVRYWQTQGVVLQFHPKGITVSIGCGAELLLEQLTLWFDDLER